MNDELMGRIPPNDVEAEQAVLGSMLVDKDAVLTVIEILKTEDFYRNEHAEIYGAILDLYDRYPVAYVIGTRNDNGLVFRTFDKALAAQPD